MFLGDRGTELKVNTGQDISAASEVLILYSDPSGTRGSWTGSVSDSNYILYEFASDDITTAGTWVIQGKITFSASSVYYTEIETFPAYPNIGA